MGSKFGILAETGNNIVTDGLVFNIDSSIKKSYPRTGTNVFNLASGSLTPTGSLINDVGWEGINPTSSFIFDGTDDYVDVEEMLQLSNVTALTVSLWFTAASSGNKILLDFKEGNSRVVVQRIGGKIYLYVNTVYGEYTVSTSLDTWYHLAYVFDGTGASDADKLKLYINSTEITDVSFSGTVDSSIGAFSPGFMKCKIGSLYNNASPSTYNWVGKLLNVQIYTKAFTASDVLQNYNAGKDTFGL